jgi:acyl-CoA thioesterase-1
VRIIQRTRERHLDTGIVIAGMEAPPNMGERYTQAFHGAFPELARKYGAALVPSCSSAWRATRR